MMTLMIFVQVCFASCISEVTYLLVGCLIMVNKIVLGAQRGEVLVVT